MVFGHGQEQPDPNIHFPDLPDEDARFRWANLAVKHALMDRLPDGRFLPEVTISLERLAIGITHGLGLDSVATNIQRIVPQAPYYGGFMVVFMGLRLKYYERNYAFSVKIWPTGGYPRGNMAYTLQRIDYLESWRRNYLISTFTEERCQPPQANAGQQTALNYGFERLGSPYLYGGESEAEGGFDCSGFVYNTLSMRMGYPMKRVADDQARDENYLSINRAYLKPGDAIFFYDEAGGGSTGHVGHAGMYVGNGIFIHSAGSNGGVSLDCLDTSSYYSTHLAWGRRVVGGPYRDRFEEYLLLFNPDASSASVQVQYISKKEPPFTRTYTVAPRSRYTIRVDDQVDYDEVSLKVTADRDIVAERAMYYSYMGKMPGGEASPGVSIPSLSWYFSEGYTVGSFDTWLLLFNPSDSAAQVRCRYLLESSKVIEQNYMVSPGSRTTISVDGVPGMEGTGVALQVESTNGVGIVAERVMYFDYMGNKGGSGGIGVNAPAGKWYLAEGYTGSGFDTYLTLANPSEDLARVQADFLLEGRDRVTEYFDVAPHSRLTVKVNEIVPKANVAVEVGSLNGVGIVAERVMYFNYGGKRGGHASAGASTLSSDWFFAEGYTGGSFDNYLVLANPWEEQTGVVCRFFRDDGVMVERNYRVAPQSRFTIKVDDIGGLESAAYAIRVSSDRPVIAERASYFSYRGWDGGSDAKGVAAPRREWYFAEGYTGG